MKKRYFIGVILISLGIIWSTIIIPYLIDNILPVQLSNPEKWTQLVYMPSASLSVLIYLALLLIWVYGTYNQRYKTSNEAKQARGQWMLIMGIGIFLNLTALFLCINLIVVQNPPNMSNTFSTNLTQAYPYEYLIPFAFVNAFLLYWLPSCFISQRTLRFIPPFSYRLTSLLEKR
jgi:hypothetical protein